MLYDEQGRAYVERPLIPKEQHLFYIVKDYKRMYHEYWTMKEKYESMKRKHDNLNSENMALRRIAQRHVEAIRHCAKYMKKSNLSPSPWLQRYMEENLI